MDITNPKQRVKNGLSFMIGGFLISLLLDYFWSNLHWQESLFRKESLIRLVIFFVVGFFYENQKRSGKAVKSKLMQEASSAFRIVLSCGSFHSQTAKVKSHALLFSAMRHPRNIYL